ncbi:hypothetical protein DFJ43DRAFT_359232 [Lentinula guzmanii]|uniref:Uncharacterized protein n=1 Tax=Lentinula guzmanii TaxID=2804957 RepID=A0AA38JGP2_9AGAR|nr:hypothetical protein DFJ43DRAFT_359232 [Lentinula guzmanii]
MPRLSSTLALVLLASTALGAVDASNFTRPHGRVHARHFERSSALAKVVKRPPGVTSGLGVAGKLAGAVAATRGASESASEPQRRSDEKAHESVPFNKGRVGQVDPERPPKHKSNRPPGSPRSETEDSGRGRDSKNEHDSVSKVGVKPKRRPRLSKVEPQDSGIEGPNKHEHAPINKREAMLKPQVAPQRQPEHKPNRPHWFTRAEHESKDNGNDVSHKHHSGQFLSFFSQALNDRNQLLFIQTKLLLNIINPNGLTGHPRPATLREFSLGLPSGGS